MGLFYETVTAFSGKDPSWAVLPFLEKPVFIDRELIKLAWPQGALAGSTRRHDGLENSGWCVAATLCFTPGLVQTPSHSTCDPLSRPGLSWSLHQELQAWGAAGTPCSHSRAQTS